MVAWELVVVLGSLFVWGLARGTTVCVSICVPGLLPYLAERPRGAWEGAVFGLLLCLPRLVIFAVIGLVWGAVSYAIFRTTAFEEAAEWLHVVGYIFLGIVIVGLGLGMFLKAAREKEDLRQKRLKGTVGPSGRDSSEDSPGLPSDCPAPGEVPRHRLSRTLSALLLRLVPASDRSERAFVLMWGSILGLACLLEVSVLEVGLLGGAAATHGEGTLMAAGLGAMAMVAFALGATVPVVVASSAFAAYVGTIETRERLVSLRVTGSLVMVMIGGLLVLRYAVVLAALG